MNMDFSQFHFIQPLWLLLIPAAVILWLLIKRRNNAGQWQKYMPAEMIAALRVGADQQTTRNSALMLIASLLLIAALAGPSWTKQPVPTLQNQHAMVVLLDLSPSMMAQDLQPNRLTLARFKLIDILRQQQDGQIALIAYAGGAHTVSPLTDDPRTIEALLPALHPSIIPSSGSNVEAAVDLALKLLRDAGAAQGDLLLITDGVASDAISELESRIPANIRLSILGVGGDQPTPIPAQGGGFVKSATGEIVLAELNENQLQKLASNLGGKYARLASDNGDVSRLIFDSVDALPGLQNKESTFDSWIDMGYWLVLLVLPLALLWFRKGVIYLLPLMFIAPFDSQAQTNLEQASQERSNQKQSQNSSISSAWQKLWSTPDQRATQLMQQERFSEAANTYKRDDWSAIANYKAGNYAEAAEALSNKDDVTSLYNRANATALAGDLDKAQELYEQVLEKQPDHPDAANNKKVIEELKKQQQKSQSEQGDGEQNQEQEQNQQNEQQSGNQSQELNQSADQENEQSADSKQQSGQTQDEQQSPSAEQSGSESSESENSGSENKGEKNQQSEQADKDEQGEEQAENENTKPSEQEQESEGSEESQLAAQATDETPLDDASEQWLRSIKDDPSGLLRRKFEHQAKERALKAARTQQPAPTDQRY